MTALPPASLPAPADADFAARLRTLDASLPDAEASFRNLLSDQTRSADDRFCGLYGLLHRLRREYRYSEYAQEVKRYEAEFSTQPYFDTFRVVVARWSGGDYHDLIRAIDPAERAVERLPDQIGVLHQYADLIAGLSEVRPDQAERYLPGAMGRVNRAITLAAGSPDRTHYFATRARLLLASGDLESARHDIERAISEERNTSLDYPRRISRYESTRLLILMKQQQATFEEKQQRLLTELDDFKGQQLTLLGLVGAVIALIAVSASTVTRVASTEAARLITGFGGVIVLVFSAVAGTLAGSRPSRIWWSVTIGGALITISATPVIWRLWAKA